MNTSLRCYAAAAWPWACCLRCPSSPSCSTLPPPPSSSTSASTTPRASPPHTRSSPPTSLGRGEAHSLRSRYRIKEYYRPGAGVNSIDLNFFPKTCPKICPRFQIEKRQIYLDNRFYLRKRRSHKRGPTSLFSLFGVNEGSI